VNPLSLLQAQIAGMKPSDRRALVLLTVFLSVVGGYVLLLEPVVSRYQGVQAELEDLTISQRDYQQKVRMLPHREAKLEEYRAALAALKQHYQMENVTPEVAVSRIISELTYYADLANVAVMGVRPLEAEVSGIYLESPIEAEAEGSYAQLHKFIYSLETSPLLLVVTDIDLRPQTATVMRARFKLSNVAGHDTAPQEAQSAVAVGTTDRLRILLSPWVGYAPVIIAKQRGFFGQGKLQVDVIPLDQVETAERLLSSGDADGVGTTLPGLMGYWANGLRLKVILPLDSTSGTEGLVVAKDADVTSTQGLRNHTVAVDGREVLNFALFRWLSAAGLSMADIVTEQHEASRLPRELDRGNLQAGVLREPLMSALLRGGQVRLVQSSEGLSPIEDLLAVSPAAIENKAGALALFIEGLNKAREFMTAHPDQAAQIVADWNAQPVDLNRELLAKVHFMDRREAGEFFAPENFKARLALFEEYFRAVGRPVPLVTPDDVMDPSFLEQALQQGSTAVDGGGGDGDK